MRKHELWCNNTPCPSLRGAHSSRMYKELWYITIKYTENNGTSEAGTLSRICKELSWLENCCLKCIRYSRNWCSYYKMIYAYPFQCSGLSAFVKKNAWKYKYFFMFLRISTIHCCSEGSIFRKCYQFLLCVTKNGIQWD